MRNQVAHTLVSEGQVLGFFIGAGGSVRSNWLIYPCPSPARTA
eukprot:jgi/Mesvir1/1957/Mv25343-RA.1